MRRLRGAWMREVGGDLAGSAHGADGVSWAGEGVAQVFAQGSAEALCGD